MNHQYKWDVYRYVLDDPTLDRPAFESQMLDDETLAMAVAQAMAEMELLQSASQVSSQLQTTSSASSDASWPWHTWLTLAAGWLLAIGLGAYGVSQLGDGTTSESLASTQKLIAENWLAIRDVELADPLAADVEAQDTILVLPIDPVPQQEEDWLIEAAREFYAEGAAS